MNSEKKSNNNTNYKENKNTEHYDEILLSKHIHDIKNFKCLSQETLHTINESTYADRLKILKTYNSMMEYFTYLLEDENIIKK